MTGMTTLLIHRLWTSLRPEVFKSYYVKAFGGGSYHTTSTVGARLIGHHKTACALGLLLAEALEARLSVFSTARTGFLEPTLA